MAKKNEALRLYYVHIAGDDWCGDVDRMLHKADDKIGCEDCLGDSY